MRRLLVLAAVALVALAVARGDARARRRGTHGPAPAHGAARVRIDGDAPASAFECDTPRATRAYGSTDRCLRALCAGANVVNAYVLDGASRLRRNPCAGVALDGAGGGR